MSMTKRDVLNKCIIIFEAIRRAASKGNAGMEPAEGMEQSFRTDSEILEILRNMVREMEAGEGQQIVRDWQKDLMENGLPERMTL